MLRNDVSCTKIDFCSKIYIHVLNDNKHKVLSILVQRNSGKMYRPNARKSLFVVSFYDFLPAEVNFPAFRKTCV